MKITAFDAHSDVQSIGVRLAPIDVGFDLRTQRMSASLPLDTTIASYADHSGRRWVVEGSAEEIAGVLRKAGYIVSVDPLDGMTEDTEADKRADYILDRQKDGDW